MSNVVEFNKSKPSTSYQSERERFQTGYEVEIIRRKKDGFPMMFVKDTGYLHRHANEFLITRYKSPEFISDKLQMITPVTLRNYAEHIRYWLNICAHTGKSYLEVDADYLKSVLRLLREDHGLAESSVSQYIQTWRLFYDFLSLTNTNHRMNLPAKVNTRRLISEAESASDFLNYTRKNNTVEINQEPLVDRRRITKKGSYISNVLDGEQLRAFIIEIAKIDIVYGVMAKVQYDTLLRISELIDYVPYESNAKNPNWKSYSELYTSGQPYQVLNFIGKGQKERKINFQLPTQQFLETNYIACRQKNDETNESTELTIYEQRKHLFLTKYLPSKDGRKSKFTSSSDVLWLRKTGRPVSVGMYQEAFRETASKLKRKGVIPEHVKVVPHSMRHTGASLRLLKYKEETGVDIHIDNKGDIHAFLQDLLGHCDMNTTMLYIRTVRDQQFQNLAERTTDRMESVFESELQTNAALRAGLDAIRGNRGRN